MLTSAHFGAYFRELWGQDPFAWQRRLARQLCEGEWPDVIDLPTASGKTACLDIAVFALAVQTTQPPAERTVGRRIFFVVNRRVIVDEAHQRAIEIARKLAATQDGAHSASPLHQVANALIQLAGGTASDGPPLDVAVLRGGIYRDNRWARSITQPTIITSTIDQIGSRLLFRGYGVSDAARPIHAALIAHDSTVLLDEAHISQPFAQTLDAVRRYRGTDWATEPIRTPFAVVSMTATPNDRMGDVFRLDDDDRANPVLARRRGASKTATLIEATSARGKKASDELAKVFAQQAQTLASDGLRTVAVIVNRVATARAVYAELTLHHTDDDRGTAPEVHLAIGRMRPIDRDDLTHAIQQRVGPAAKQSADTAPMFVVATQCLEVGADFDFDAMISECASIDALRQRFGRLNRTGRDIKARGCIVIRADQVDGDDPIYGTALAATWKWLQTVATENTVDFGIHSMEAMLDGIDLAQLLAPRVNAPVIFPAYIDTWAQTHPAPCPDPDVSLFLHGPERGEPDVNVCWRNDLPDNADEDTWTQIVGLCPPSSPECMSVPIGVVRNWLARQSESDNERGDTLDAQTPGSQAADVKSNTSTPKSKGGERRSLRSALVWRGPSKSTLVRRPGDLRPGDTLVLPVSAGGWSVLGHIPGAPLDPTDEMEAVVGDDRLARIDIAERAYRQSRGQVILRLTPSRFATWPRGEAAASLGTWLRDLEADLHTADIRVLLRQVAEAMPAEQATIAATLRVLANAKYGLTIDRYPDAMGVVLATRHRVPPNRVLTSFESVFPAMDDGDDETSRTRHRNPISLLDHTDDVLEELDRALPLLSITALSDALRAAAYRHDWGKADDRFQAMLVNGDRDDAWAQPTLWAKSVRMPMAPAERANARKRSDLPDGFRHEMLSLQLAECAADQFAINPVECDLVLHLTAAHHGRARPFAPVVLDDSPPDVSLDALGISVSLTDEQRLKTQPHCLDSGVTERFWKLTRRFGWWGLAYVEAVLRLADQSASAREDDTPDEVPAAGPVTVATP